MSDAPAENRFYLKSYGAWAGDLKGRAPDYTCCCESVWSRGRWSRSYQCQRKRGFGPDKAYCKQHDPEVAKARKDAADARSNAKWQARRLEIYGKTFFDALKKIADGHNDARGLAQEVIDTFNKGAV